MLSLTLILLYYYIAMYDSHKKISCGASSTNPTRMIGNLFTPIITHELERVIMHCCILTHPIWAVLQVVIKLTLWNNMTSIERTFCKFSLIKIL